MKINWRTWLPLSTLAVCGVGGYAGWKLTGIPDAGAELQAEVEAATKLGLPLTADDMRQLAHAEPAQNAARYYGVLARFEPSDPAMRNLNLLAQNEKYGFTRSERALLRHELAAIKRELDTLVTASTFPRLDMKRMWEQVPLVPVSEPSRFRMVAKCFVLMANQSSLAARPLEALRDVEALFGLARQAAQEPCTDGIYGANSLYTSGFSAVENVCLKHPTNREVLSQALRIVEGMRLPDVRPGLAGETFVGLNTIRLLAADPDAFGDRQELGSLALLRYTSVRRAFEAKLLKHQRQLYEDLPSDPEDYKSLTKALIEAEAREDSDEGLVSQAARILYPYATSLGDAMATLNARRSIAKVAIMLLQRERPFPKKLELPIDPFSEKPLRYVSSGDGFLLYSLGRDRDDDGGMARYDAARLSGEDLRWRYPAITPKRPPAIGGPAPSGPPLGVK